MTKEVNRKKTRVKNPNKNRTDETRENKVVKWTVAETFIEKKMGQYHFLRGVLTPFMDQLNITAGSLSPWWAELQLHMESWYHGSYGAWQPCSK